MDEDSIFIRSVLLLFLSVLSVGAMFTIGSLEDYDNYGQSYDDAEYDYLKSNVNLTRMVMDHKYCDRVSELYKDELEYDSSIVFTDKLKHQYVPIEGNNVTMYTVSSDGTIEWEGMYVVVVEKIDIYEWDDKQ